MLAVQLIWCSSCSSTSTQQSSVANRFARPPAARQICMHPHPVSRATWRTASSSETSPSSSSVTQTCPNPSISRSRTSSCVRTCPLASSFLPPWRKIVQQRIRPAESRTSIVCALKMHLPQCRLVICAPYWCCAADCTTATAPSIGRVSANSVRPIGIISERL